MQDPQAPVRIVHCANYGGPYAGSFVPMLASVATAARERGYETTICFSDVARDRPWLNELDGLAEIRFIDSTGIPTQLRQLREVLSEADGHPTVLHTHFGAFDLAAALLRTSRRRTVVVWHAHGGTKRRVRLRSKVHGTVLGRLVDAIICVSPEIREELRARCFPDAKLHLLLNAIDQQRFSPITADERAAARRALGLPPDSQVVLHFGWDWVRKGGDRMLAVAQAMAGARELVFVTVVGEDAQDVPREALGRLPNVRTLTPQSDVKALYAAADLFLNCSRSEGLPYALLEALARGLPVVATDLPVQREVLTGLPGSRVVSGEPRAIADGIRQALEFSPAQRTEHEAAAGDRIAASYALGPWSEHVLALYEELLSGRSRS